MAPPSRPRRPNWASPIRSLPLTSTVPCSTARPIEWPSGRSSASEPPCFSLTSQRLIGVNVFAGPLRPSNAPAITLSVPASSGSGTVGMSRLRSVWYPGFADLALAGRLTQSWTISSVPPCLVKASEWYSSCRIPPAAVIHCTSPGPIWPPLPAESR
ncbi:hypothetical protein D9M69_545670 [compost metagenome]